MPVSQTSQTTTENSGPNTPALYSLSNLLLSKPSSSSPSGLTSYSVPLSTGLVDVEIPPFPGYVKSGVLTPSPNYGTNVGAFWQALFNS